MHRNGGVVRGRLKAALLGSAAASLIATAAMAAEQPAISFDIAAQDAGSALNDFSRQSGLRVLFPYDSVEGKRAPAVRGDMTATQALDTLLKATGLVVAANDGTTVTLTAPQSGSAAGGGAEVEALIVTAQKREEDIQDVPIAISAFTQEDLTRSQVAGGPDLMTQVPNMTFTKTNFSSYSIQIRGIGTQAISATTDAAVAVAFNNTPFIRNRFFEQEFYDLERVEVLRGPQGTLYGRNATAGVVNIISAKPSFGYEARLSADLANYSSSRLEGMINIPLVEDVAALRLAGAWTKREGFATNQQTERQIDGRDLWSTRLSLRVEPNDRFRANLIWEHFEEDDDRLRSGKQLCKTDVVTEVGGITSVTGIPLAENPLLGNLGQGGGSGGAAGILGFAGAQAILSQGCAPSSLYSPDSFQTPNGVALPYYVPLGALSLPTGLDDPYASRGQSHDLRVIESSFEPRYQADSDLVELQFSFDVTDGLTITSETAYSIDSVFSTQDYNRFTTAPGAWDLLTPGGVFYRPGLIEPGPEGGIYCDPQLGCSDRLLAADLSTARARQFSQEIRLASNFDGPFNFSLGANYLRADSEDKYYVFINSLGIISALGASQVDYADFPYVAGVTDNTECLNAYGYVGPDYSIGHPVLQCTYIDPNPIGALNDLGHNYFLSKNPYKLISYAVFGEAYYNIADNLKLTAGLRWTVDKKHAPLIPSWLLASNTLGYPVAEVIDQEWREPTGRLTLDWKPDLSFTDETLLYASYARGYKAGGANPPPYGVAVYGGTGASIGGQVSSELIIDESATKPKTFEAEFVDAFEVGAKNTLFDAALTVNTSAFYYDYKNYQISQIVDRSAANMNFDAEVWGLELEADWRAAENLRLGLKLGYENTRVGDVERAIDIMDRTAGREGWVLYRPFPSIPSNCVFPEWVLMGNTSDPGNLELVNVGSLAGGGPGGCELAYIFDVDPVTRKPYVANPPLGDLPPMHTPGIDYAAYSTDPADYPCSPVGVPTGGIYPGVDPRCLGALSNNGQGFYKDLGGNELPNAPNLTATITADYTVPLPNAWLLTLHTDLYYQSEAWTRIFNTEGYDKLKAYTNVNLAAIFTNEDAGWKVMAYIKNVMDRDSITGAFLNSDDTGLTTNVFLTEPRLYGLRVTKEFTGGPWWTGARADHTGPFPLTVELGGQVQRHDAPNELVAPGFTDQLASLNIYETQNDDLDWGDGREVKLTYQASPTWRLSLGARFGLANHGASDAVTVREPEASEACLLDAAVCPSAPQYFLTGDFGGADPKNWMRADTYLKEEHTVVDFAVGREVGLGLAASTLSAGLRYASLKSTAHLAQSGLPDWDFPAGYAFLYDSQWHVYEADVEARREFEGVGPVLTWEAAKDFMGDDQTGRLGLAWSVSGGVLFGKQKTEFSGEVVDQIYDQHYFVCACAPLSIVTPRTPDQVTTTDLARRRSDSVTVPTFAASLGLSYQVNRLSLGAGYRWERYFDAIDGGYDEASDQDRTIDGPYFKIAVGFGG